MSIAVVACASVSRLCSASLLGQFIFEAHQQVKVAERRATLLGLNAPIGQAVAVVQHEPENKPTSTERLRAPINRIRDQRHQDDLPAPDQDDPPSTQ